MTRNKIGFVMCDDDEPESLEVGHFSRIELDDETVVELDKEDEVVQPRVVTFNDCDDCPFMVGCDECMFEDDRPLLIVPPKGKK